MPDFWISFATDDDGFLGACIIQAASSEEAFDRTDELGINPGGEAMILMFPDTDKANAEIAALGRDRLISKAEAMGQGAKRLGDLPDEMRAEIEAAADTCCAECNCKGEN